MLLQTEIKSRRLAAGLTPKQFATLAGCTTAYLHQIESQTAKNRRTASPAKLAELEQLLNKADTARAVVAAIYAK